MASPESLSSFVDDIIEASSRSEVYSASVDLSRDVLPADVCEISAVDGDEVDVLARSHGNVLFIDASTPVAEDLYRQTDLIGRSHIFDNITEVRSVSASSASAPAGSYTPRSVLLVPIEGVGLFVATNDDAAVFSDSDRRWAERLGACLRGITHGWAASRSNDSTLAQTHSAITQEFTEPLNVLRASLELAEAEGEDRRFEQARDAVDRIEHLLEAIERLTMVDGDTESLEIVDFRVVLSDVWSAMPTDHIDLEIETSKPFAANRQALHLLVTNLITTLTRGDVSSVSGGVTDAGFYLSSDRDIADGSDVPTTRADFGEDLAEKVATSQDWHIERTVADDGQLTYSVSGLTDQ